MGRVKGQKEYEKFRSGARLTRKEAIAALCYECNGFEEGNVDCEGRSCPLYQFMRLKGVKSAEPGEEPLPAGQREIAQISR